LDDVEGTKPIGVRAESFCCRIVALTERVLELLRKLAGAFILADKNLYQRQIEATDRQIDALVYELYGLTEEEIGIVDDATR